MSLQEFCLWLLCIGGGFLLGSVMFSQVLPKIFLGKDITAESDDHNPGATNVFIACGPVWGMACLGMDLLKGYLPVFLSYHFLDPRNLMFAAVMVAPVAGHALAPFNHFRGGKCIATCFGVLLGLFSINHIVVLLAAIYIVFSTIVKITPNRIRSITTFSLFGVVSMVILIYSSEYSIALGCTLISLIAIVKHSKRFALDESYAVN